MVRTRLTPSNVDVVDGDLDDFCSAMRHLHWRSSPRSLAAGLCRGAVLVVWLGGLGLVARVATGNAVRTSLIVVVSVTLLVSLSIYGSNGNFNLSG